MAFEGLSDKLSAVFKKLRNKGKLTESDVKTAMREVRLALLEADVNYKVAKDFVAKVSERAVGAEVLESLTPAQHVIKIVNEELTALMGESNARIQYSSKIPTIIMMVGLQGSGKTTHSGKLALHFKKMGKRPLLVACDVYRPAAIDQLKVVGGQIDVPVFEMGQIDPLTIAKKAVSHAKDYGNDIVILDTAGRLHVDTELMDELLGLKNEFKPEEILLVIDSMTGQDAVNVAETFNEKLGITGTILTKLDGDTRGGAALSVRAVTGAPIKFIGTGEKLTDLEAFHPDRMASRILGMGDVLTLIERAEEQMDAKKAEEMARKMGENKFDLEDLLAQMKQVKKMGSLSQIAAMIPGAKKKLTDEEEAEGEKQLKRTEAIISSMTKKERAKPSIIDAKRKKRIAAGSGTDVSDVNRLLKQFEQMQKMMKQLSGNGKQGKKMRQMLSQMENSGGMGGMNLPF